MTRCVKCRKEIYMPFICTYCSEAFCSDHRLPENHNCKNIHTALPPHARVQSTPTESYPTETSWQPTPGAQVERYFEPDGTEVIIERVPMYVIQRPENPIWKFSALELQHLALGLILMFGVGISMFFTIYWLYGKEPDWGNFLLLALFVTLAFLLHEFGHKFVGIRLGNWSEFRLIKIFTILTAISVIPFNPIKIVCPGAVQVTGDTSTENMGKIALAGPVVNLILAAIFIILANILFVPTDNMFNVLIIATNLNSLLGIFNLIPFGPLDGLKVIRWNKIYYFITIALLIAILVYVFPLMKL
ncbi:MAG: hypothetical protein HWN66_09360 [Candidatus Helarchaeota archaeon]|nr:hypothetical protein [Candidatus Helarchaeota archaeon]